MATEAVMPNDSTGSFTPSVDESDPILPNQQLLDIPVAQRKAQV
jgi:hypothetical protein